VFGYSLPPERPVVTIYWRTEGFERGEDGDVRWVEDRQRSVQVLDGAPLPEEHVEANRRYEEARRVWQDEWQWRNRDSDLTT